MHDEKLEMEICLCLHDWPGNVRELELLARRMLAFWGDQETLTQEHVQHCLQQAPGTADAPSRPPAPVCGRDTVEIKRLLEALRTCRGNVVRAASAVGISRQRAYRLLKTVPGVSLEAFRR